jgi:hypothetical protein
MIKSLRNLRWLVLSVAISFVASCSGSIDTDVFDVFGKAKPPLPCPKLEVLPGTDSITIFQEGQGRDLVDVRFEGVLAPVSGLCQYVDDDSVVEVELVLRIGAIKGPAAEGQVEEFPYFVAIAERSGKILAKKIFYSPIEIPEGRRRGAVEEEIDQRIPLPGIKTGADYIIILGFQLTEEQLKLRQKSSGN